MDDIAIGRRHARDAVAEVPHRAHARAEGGNDRLASDMMFPLLVGNRIRNAAAPVEDRGPAHPVDAGDRIDRSPQKRREHDHAYPADGRAHLILGHRGMDRRRRAEEERNRRQDMRPVMFQKSLHRRRSP